MGTYGSAVTSWRMIPSGKIAENASGPTGSRVAGFKGGASSKGRSGTMLYQLSDNAFSSSRNLVGSIRKPPVLGWSTFDPQLTDFRAAASAAMTKGGAAGYRTRVISTGLVPRGRRDDASG